MAPTRLKDGAFGGARAAAWYGLSAAALLLTLDGALPSLVQCSAGRSPEHQGRVFALLVRALEAPLLSPVAREIPARWGVDAVLQYQR